MPQTSGFDCLGICLGDQDRLGFLLECCVPQCSATSLLDLPELVLDGTLESSRLVVLGDFSVFAKAPQGGAAQHFRVAMAIICLSQVMSGHTHSALCFIQIVVLVISKWGSSG